MPARIFLYVIAAIIGLLLLAGVIWSLFQKELMEAALVPSIPFTAPSPLAANAYAGPGLWYARPEMGMASPGEWLPTMASPKQQSRAAALFYIHPTTYLGNDHWNAPVGDREAADRAALMLRNQATAFNASARIWAPRYRQATFGVFLKDSPAAKKALDYAYRDVAAAFRQFVTDIPADQPVILAGHSQGTLHLLRLVKEEVARQPIGRRIIAIYAIGWPISIAHDLPALGFPACTQPEQTGCVQAWQSFADPANPQQIQQVYDATNGLDGLTRAGTPMLCTNPLTGGATPDAAASRNLGTLTADAVMEPGALEPGKVPARCSDAGWLIIGTPPEGFGTFILPGNNFHLFDYNLFWANIRADSIRRTNAYGKSR